MELEENIDSVDDEFLQLTKRQILVRMLIEDSLIIHLLVMVGFIQLVAFTILLNGFLQIIHNRNRCIN
jgi:hypothetical protein